MKDSEKRNILILAVVAVIIIVGLKVFVKKRAPEGVNMVASGETIQNEVKRPEEEVEEYVQVLEDGSKLNISDNVAKEKIFDGLIISNIQLKMTGRTTRLLADVENKTNTKTEDKMIKVEVLDKSGQVITTMKGFISPIEAGGKGKINMSVPADVSNAYDIRISNV